VSLIKGGRSQQEAFARLGIDRSEFVTGGRPVTAEGVISGLGLSGINAEGLRAQISAALNDPTLRGNQAALTAKIADIVAGSGAGGAMDRSAIADATRTALQGAGMNIDILGLLRRIRERGGEGELVHIFEGRQFPKISALLNANIDEILSKLLQDAPNSTQQAAERMNQGLSRAWDNFISNLQKLEDAIGKSGINTLLSRILDGLSFVLDKLSNTNPVILFGATIVALGTAAIAAVAKVVALTAAISRLGAAGAVGTAGTALGTGTATAAGAAAAGRLGLASRLGLWGLGAYGLYLGMEAADAQGQEWRRLNPDIAGRIDRGEMMFSLPPPPAPTPVPDRLPTLQDFIAGLQSGNLNGASTSAGQGAGQAFSGAFTGSVQGATAEAERLLQEWARSLNLNVTITPRIDTSALGGLHADMGVAPER
jgi:hypothetical protein